MASSGLARSAQKERPSPGADTATGRPPGIVGRVAAWLLGKRLLRRHIILEQQKEGEWLDLGYNLYGKWDNLW